VSAGHLVRRFVTSLSRQPPTADAEAWARAWFTAGEGELWAAMPTADRRHAIEVARQFIARRPQASRAEIAGALLHDVGKVPSRLGTFGRVAATIAGPRTRRFRLYHDHEVIGANMAAQAGSDQLTVALIRGTGPAAADLRAADDSI
jgi:hypothetical protein